MYTFAVELCEQEEYFTEDKIVGKLHRDGKCLYDEFTKSIKDDKNIYSELDKIKAHIEDFALGKNIPKKQGHFLKGSASDIFEVKSKHLRVYLCKDSDNTIIILGGKKTNQDKDISKAQTIYKNLIKFQKDNILTYGKKENKPNLPFDEISERDFSTT